MRGMGHAANAPMRIKLAVKRAEIVAPFYMDTRSRLAQVRYPAPEEARRRSHLGEKSEIRVVRAGCARPHHTNFFSSQGYDLGRGPWRPVILLLMPMGTCGKGPIGKLV